MSLRWIISISLVSLVSNCFAQDSTSFSNGFAIGSTFSHGGNSLDLGWSSQWGDFLLGVGGKWDWTESASLQSGPLGYYTSVGYIIGSHEKLNGLILADQRMSFRSPNCSDCSINIEWEYTLGYGLCWTPVKDWAIYQTIAIGGLSERLSNQLDDGTLYLSKSTLFNTQIRCFVVRYW